MKLLLHVCCAIDACHVFRELSREHDIAGYFYDPNIQPHAEYALRLSEARRVADELDIPFYEGPYNVDDFFTIVRGYEQEPERYGARCGLCFQMRLEETARKCAELGYDAFTTTLTTSPKKEADMINYIGMTTAPRYGVAYWPSNFKKKNGYLETTRYATELDLYRQNYCGCIMSIRPDAPAPYVPDRLANTAGDTSSSD